MLSGQRKHNFSKEANNSIQDQHLYFSPYEIAKYCRIYGINNKIHERPWTSKYKIKKEKLSKINFK